MNKVKFDGEKEWGADLGEWWKGKFFMEEDTGTLSGSVSPKVIGIPECIRCGKKVKRDIERKEGKIVVRFPHAKPVYENYRYHHVQGHSKKTTDAGVICEECIKKIRESKKDE